MFITDYGLEHPDVTRVRGVGAGWWDEAEELAQRFSGGKWEEAWT